MDSELQTLHLNILLDRFKEGDRQALNELLRRTSRRMESLARAMLRQFPSVRNQEQTADIVQESTLSLIKALAQINFASTRDFYGLAAEHMRRRLLDLARKYANPVRAPESLPAGHEDHLYSPDTQAENLEKWEAFHEAIEKLPTDLQEVISLRFYHNWSVDQIAKVFQVSSRTIARLYSRALLALATSLEGHGFPVIEKESSP